MDLCVWCNNLRFVATKTNQYTTISIIIGPRGLGKAYCDIVSNFNLQQNRSITTYEMMRSICNIRSGMDLCVWCNNLRFVATKTNHNQAARLGKGLL
jgi:hypothetical protein